MALDFDVTADHADWLVSAAQTAAEVSLDAVCSIVLLGPPGYAAYARVLGLPDPQHPGQAEPDEVIDRFPDDGELVRDTVHLLAALTTTPGELFLLFWDGWPYAPQLPPGNRVDLAGVRRYALARGELRDWREWAQAGPDRGYPPALIWPADRSWCLAFDVDSHFAAVGGSAAAIDVLLRSSTLEVVPTSRTDRDWLLYG